VSQQQQQQQQQHESVERKRGVDGHLADTARVVGTRLAELFQREQRVHADLQ
jgi:hypothetical protein